jgi:hypothetical protein
MRQKLELLEGQHSAGAELPDEKPTTHSTYAAAQLDTSESWDTTSKTGNAGCGSTDVGLVSVHDPRMEL